MDVHFTKKDYDINSSYSSQRQPSKHISYYIIAAKAYFTYLSLVCTGTHTAITAITTVVTKPFAVEVTSEVSNRVSQNIHRSELARQSFVSFRS